MMNSSTLHSKRLLALAVALILGAGAIEMATAEDRGSASRKARGGERVTDAVMPDPEAEEGWRVTAALQEDGSWAIAGVVGLSKDEFGRNVIEVKKDGDFDTDAVLQLFVPLVELDNGEIAAGGIVNVQNNGETVTLTVREAESLDGKAVARMVTISLRVAMLGGCEGVLDNGTFTCARDATVCSNSCAVKTDNGITWCTCSAASLN